MRSRALALLLLAGCAEYYYVDYPHVDLEEPDDLEARHQLFRSGKESWYGDPKAVADWAIRRYVDIPWKADPFYPDAYTVNESPEWGTYVVRRYRYPSGTIMSYRVKVRAYHDIWYPVQVSRFLRLDYPDEHGHDH